MKGASHLKMEFSVLLMNKIYCKINNMKQEIKQRLISLVGVSNDSQCKSMCIMPTAYFRVPVSL